MAPEPTKDDTKVDDTNELGTVPSHVIEADHYGIDDAYLRAPKFTKFWRSVLWQMILFGA